MCCGIVHTLVLEVPSCWSRELGVRFEHFQSLEKSSFVLGSEAYSSGLIKDSVLSVWEVSKHSKTFTNLILRMPLEI